MELELSSLEIGFMDIMDELIPSLLPFVSGEDIGLCFDAGARTYVSEAECRSMSSEPGRPDHLLVASYEPCEPTPQQRTPCEFPSYHMDRDLLPKQPKELSASSSSSSKRSAVPKTESETDEAKRMRKPQIHKRCEHNVRKSECKLCGGSQICGHKRIKSRCKDCGGSQICGHRKIRTRCRECKLTVGLLGFSAVSVNGGYASPSVAAPLGLLKGGISGLSVSSLALGNSLGGMGTMLSSGYCSSGHAGALCLGGISNIIPMSGSMGEESMDALKHIRV